MNDRRNPQRPRGLLEPDAWKPGTSGSEGAPARQRAAATRRCHLHARMSGRMWEQYGKVRYYLHRWPSQRAMKNARTRVKALTGRNRVGVDLEDTIAALNRFLRGWGGYFRTGNASNKFAQLDRYVAWRLKRLLIKRRGRNLRAGQAQRWTPAWFHDQGLHTLLGTVRYPKAA